MNLRKVLLVTYGGGHAAMMAPVARRLVERNRISLTVLGLTTGGQTYRRAGVEARGYRDYVDPAKDAEALALGDKLVGDVNNEAVGVTREESVAYMGLCLQDLIEEIGEEAAWKRYRDLGRHSFNPRRTLARILDREQPDLVVATNSPKSERAAVAEANARGIPTLIVPDLFAAPAWETYHPFQARWYAVMCDATADNLVAHHGADPRRIVVTGQPAFQKSAVPDRAESTRYVSELLGGKDPGRFLAVATSWDIGQGAVQPGSNEQGRAVLAKLVELADRFPEHRFLLKPHPSEPDGPYRQLAAGSDRVAIVPGRADINRVARASEGLIAASITTAIVDALTLDVPVAAVNLTRRHDVFPFESLDIPVTETLEGLEALVRLRTAGEGIGVRQARIRAELRELNGNAVANVADIIEQLAEGTAPAPRRQAG